MGEEYVTPRPGKTVDERFLRSLTRERYAVPTPSPAPGATDDGPTAQWMHERGTLWREDDEQ